MAVKWHEPPRDAIDTLILSSSPFEIASLSEVEQIEFIPFNPFIKRTEATVRISGKIFKVTKGYSSQLLIFTILFCKDNYFVLFHKERLKLYCKCAMTVFIQRKLKQMCIL